MIKIMFDNRYRSISGACNNLENPEWGTAGRQMVRILPPDYEVSFFGFNFGLLFIISFLPPGPEVL